jgi:hypothetical protein
LQKIEEIYKKAVESEKEEVPYRAPDSFPVPRSVRADKGANSFRKNGSGECGQECREKQAPRSFPSGKRIDCCGEGWEVVVAVVKKKGDRLKKKENPVELSNGD